MTLAEGYKDTELGPIPQDWDVATVAEVVQITTGSRNTQDKVEDGQFPFFVRSQTVERINSFSYDGEAVLTAGDGVGTGKIFHYINGPFDCHQRVYRMSGFGDRMDGFFFYKFFSAAFYDRIMSMTAKSSVDSVRREMIADMAIPVPPIGEQKAIAEALRDIDDLIASLDALIAKKRDIKQAAVQQLIGGLVRLPGYSGEWSETSLRHVTSQRVTYGIVTAGKFQSDGVRMLRGGDISNGAIIGDPPFVTEAKSQEFARTILQENDVVVALVGYPGEAAVVPAWLVGGNISRAVGLIRPNSRLSSRYLSHYLNSPEGRKAFLRPSAGSAQIVVNLKDLDSLPLLLPSLKEQESISDAIDDMCADLIEHERKRMKLDLLKEGMMQQLLTGRIRLV